MLDEIVYGSYYKVYKELYASRYGMEYHAFKFFLNKYLTVERGTSGTIESFFIPFLVSIQDQKMKSYFVSFTSEDFPASKWYVEAGSERDAIAFISGTLADRHCQGVSMDIFRQEIEDACSAREIPNPVEAVKMLTELFMDTENPYASGVHSEDIVDLIKALKD